MKIAIVAAGFTPGEADKLRRAMATFRRSGLIGNFETKMIEGMVKNGYSRDFAERCFRQIEGFGSYGFPESHAASFSLLVYVSAWLKCRHPDVFLCGLLNAQPMGFYAPAQLVRDARDHGVEVRPADIGHSDWDSTIEPATDGGHAVRLGLRLIKGLNEADAARIVAARATRPFADLHDLWRRAGVKRASLERLAEADAYGSLGLDRRRALWAIRGFGDDVLPLFAAADAREQGAEPIVVLPAMPLGAQMMEDYASLKLSLRAHPLALLRPVFAARGVTRAGSLREFAHGARVKVAGLAITRQRPGEGHVIFLTLEDETAIANIIVWPRVFERFRRVVMGARLIVVEGHLQKAGEGEHLVLHIVSDRLHDASRWLDTLAENRPTPDQRRRLFASRDFH
jgi:error-prone DNA polymerase